MKNISNKTLIFYTFQTEHSSVEYNVTPFKKSSPQQPKIRDVLYELPIDFQANSYHFRFKSEFFEGDQKVIAWVDISNLLSKVPMINNSIFVKVLKLPSDRQNKLFSKQKLKTIGLIDPRGLSPVKGVDQNPQIKQPQAGNISQINKNTPPIIKVKKTTQDLTDLGFSQQSVQPPAAKVQKKIEQHLNGHSLSKKKQEQNASPDVKKPNSAPKPQSQQQILKRFQEQTKHQELLIQQQRKAIQFHQVKLTQWGYSGHKTINNLTTLLATLHTIWPQWDPVSLSDMMKPEDVNSVYRKAIIKLHPDKNTKRDSNTRYLSKRAFQLLNEAKKAANK